MKYFLILFILFSSNSFAKLTILPKSTKAQYYYFEIPPKMKKTFLVQSIKCKPSANELSVSRYSTVSEVANGKVRVENLIIRSGTCKESPLSSVWQKEIKVYDEKHWTHVHVTSLSENVSIF